MKRRFLILTHFVVVALVSSGFSATTGAGLVSNAQQYLGQDYESGMPPNLNYTGQFKNGFYRYHYYWGSSVWDGNSAWTGGFDCSGLVSYAANLRRHYATAEIPGLFSAAKTWDTAVAGDIIYFSGHVAIFISRRKDENNVYWIKVVHATEYELNGESVSGVLEEEYRQTYYEGKNAFPYEFVADSTSPQISAKIVEDNTELEDGGVYAKPITVDFGATDNIAEEGGPFVKANYNDKKKFVEDGVYTLHITAEDWGKNIKDVSLGFLVDRTPPAVSLDDGRIVRGDVNYGLQINGPDLGFTFFDEIAGLKSMVLTGPNSQSLALDGHEFSSTASLADGNYTLTVEDKAGNKTIVRFAVYSLRVYLSTETSRATLNRDADSFSAQIDIAAIGSNALGNITLIDGDFAPVDTKSVVQNGVPVTFSVTGGISETKDTPKTYYAYVSDSAGNYKYMSFNLHFSRAGNYQITLPVTEKDHYLSAALDMADASQAFIPGGVMSIYAKTQTAQETLPEWWWTAGNGFYTTHTYAERELNLAQIKTVDLPLGPIQKFGHVKTVVHTWNNPDKTDSVSYTVAERDMFFVDNAAVPPGTTCGNSLEEYPSTQNYPAFVCYAETASSYTYISTKRYVQAEVELTKISPTMAASCLSVSQSDPSRCTQIYDPEPGLLIAGPELYGLMVHSVELTDVSGIPFIKGALASLDLPGIGTLSLNNVEEGGVLQYGPAYAANYPGTINLLGGLTWGFDVVNGRFSGARLEVGYDAAGLTPAQEALIRAYKIKDDGRYFQLPTTVNTSTKKVSCDTDSFSRIMFSAPAYSDPYVIQGSVLVGISPEMEFVSVDTSATQSVYDVTTPEGQGLLNSIASLGGLPVGNIYQLGPEELDLSQPGTITMRYDAGSLASSGISEDTLGIYGLSADGSVIHRLPGQIPDRMSGSIAAEVGMLYPLYAILGSTTPLEAGDVTPPSTGLLIAGPQHVSENTSYISGRSSVTLTASDPEVSGVVPSGVSAVYYLIDIPTNTLTKSTYQQPFTLSAGVHTVHYQASDAAGNLEPFNTKLLYVDASAPEAMLAVSSGMPIPGGYGITENDQVSIVAEDVLSNGVRSGLRAAYYLVDISPLACGDIENVDPSAPAGTCLNPIYSGPFSLAVGSHTVYYLAEDNVENRSELQSLYFTVASAQTALPIVPSSGPIGVPFTIEGTGFGTYSAGTTVVLLGGATAPLTLWTDTKIQGTIPGALAVGQYPVSVKRGLTVLAEVSLFTVTAPVFYTLTPSSGAIGLPFTITGESFGNYVAGFTRVLLGGATMPLTLWTDTKIQGTIPGTLPVGDYELVVERALNGGVVRTSTTTFSLRNMEAYWLAPSSGPIGMPFTITGVGFGNYSSIYTHVLIGDTTAPLTLWTDTKIQGTVPGSLASGQYPVLVERRTSDGGAMQTSPMTFEVVNVDVASMTPVAGPIGMPFTIYGGNFGNYVAGYTRVLIGGTTCPLTLWTADKIQGTIPGALGPGEYPVIVERELNGGIVQSSALAFTASTPTAYNISPASGPIGVPFTINGESFGNYSAAYTGVLINGATVPLTLWTDTKIQGTIPGNLAPGLYPVMVGRMTADGGMVGSNALTFEVVGVNVASMTPVAGPIAMPFTIYGTGFGNYSAGYTKVLIGGTTCPLTLWTDTKIQGTVPGSLAAGDYQVLVERSLNGGQIQSLPLGFSVTVPVAYTLTPSSGPIGLPFTIMGANFGNYVANYTKVLIGNVAAPLTLWTDTKLQGTIPGSLADGDHEVVVERALNGGVVRTSTFTFNVGTPYLAAVSPSTASVIAPFTITGYNFGNYVANYTKVLINGTTAPLTLWTDTKIQGKLPFLLAGTYPVQVQRYLNGGLAESATAYINVEEPVISSMTPTSGAVGTVFNLYGTGFGPYDATIAKVFLGGTQCALSLWTDTRITGTVPSGLTYGTHTVVAMRGQAVSNGLEFYIPGTYSPSMMRPGTSPSALEFKLGEVYVYPDPAKGGKVPTFHIEVGMADSVKLKVFTVAGQLAHEQTLMGSPQAVGSVYAYEYAWTGRIASGVYYFTVEAERAGKKLKAKGKFAVVR